VISAPTTVWDTIRDALTAVWERDGEIVVDKGNERIAACATKHRLRYDLDAHWNRTPPQLCGLTGCPSRTKKKGI
jgi:hypothetical protein